MEEVSGSIPLFSTTISRSPKGSGVGQPISKALTQTGQKAQGAPLSGEDAGANPAGIEIGPHGNGPGNAPK